jgi:hypothetical protein
MALQKFGKQYRKGQVPYDKQGSGHQLRNQDTVMHTPIAKRYDFLQQE